MGATAWKCPNGHVLGRVKESKNRGGTVHRLFIYRHALEEDGTDLVDVMAVVEGSITDVVCDHCGDMRTWIPDKNSLRALMRKVEGGDYGQHGE